MAKDTTNSKQSRRGFLGGLVATPVLLGGAVNAYESSARDESVQSVNSRAIDRSGSQTSATLGYPIDDEQFNTETFTYVSADSDLLGEVGRTIGEQIRLRRTDEDTKNEYAVYTVREEKNEGEQLVRSNDAGRARLDIANTSWVQTGDRRLFCPRPQQDAPINDEDETAIEVDPMVVHPELDESEAREQNEYIEFGDQAGSNAIILAPHGGDVQPETDRQAEHVSSLLGEGVSLWGTKGYRKGGGAFIRWYVPSYNMSYTSYPFLAEMAETEYEYAVAFHGTCTQNVQIGGQAPESFRVEIRDAINSVLEEKDAQQRAVLGTGEHRVDGDNTLANRLATRCGVWIGQDETTRAEHGEEVATAVADVLDSRV